MKRTLAILLIAGVMALTIGWRGGDWRGDQTIAGDYTFTDGVTVSNSTAAADTSLYLKHYGSRTGDYGIVVDMDTSANTAANVIGIDFSGSNAFDGSSDYWIYAGGSNNWRADGTLRVGNLDLATNTFNFLGSTITYFQHNTSYDFKFQWIATKKGDIIFKDGNHATNVTANLNFLQVQDSTGTVNLNIPSRDIRGSANFTGTKLIDTLVISGVTANSFIFFSFKGTTAPTSGISWNYLDANTITVHCLPADSSKLCSAGYNWFRVE